jgi:hypothetical protein
VGGNQAFKPKEGRCICSVHTRSWARFIVTFVTSSEKKLDETSLLGRHATSGCRIIVQVGSLHVTYDPSV